MLTFGTCNDLYVYRQCTSLAGCKHLAVTVLLIAALLEYEPQKTCLQQQSCLCQPDQLACTSIHTGGGEAGSSFSQQMTLSH